MQITNQFSWTLELCSLGWFSEGIKLSLIEYKEEKDCSGLEILVQLMIKKCFWHDATYRLAIDQLFFISINFLSSDFDHIFKIKKLRHQKIQRHIDQNLYFQIKASFLLYHSSKFSKKSIHNRRFLSPILTQKHSMKGKSIKMHLNNQSINLIPYRIFRTQKIIQSDYLSQYYKLKMGNIPACCNNGSQLQNISEEKMVLIAQFDSSQAKAVSLEVAKVIQKIERNSSLLQKKVLEFPKINKDIEQLRRKVRAEDKNQEFIETGQREIIGYRLGNDMAVYEGIVKEGVPHGNGKLFLSDFSYFEGQFLEGYPKIGLYIFPGSSIYYKGQISELQASGRGILQNKQTNYFYEGQWSKNLQHGFGIEKYQNGQEYVGNFLYGSKFGDGKYYFKNGDLYEGEFYSNFIDGYGTMILSYGDSYEGEWKLGKMHGRGTYVWENGQKYEGEYEDGERNGKGVYFFQDGTVLEGKWEQGQQRKHKSIEDEQSDGKLSKNDL